MDKTWKLFNWSNCTAYIFLDEVKQQFCFVKYLNINLLCKEQFYYLPWAETHKFTHFHLLLQIDWLIEYSIFILFKNISLN